MQAFSSPRYPDTRPYVNEATLSRVIHEGRFAGGIAASGQTAAFGGNLITRDACRMMRDVLRRYPWMVRELLGLLPRFQGEEVNSLTNEFPGAMPHQLFREIIAGRYLPEDRVADAEYWTRKWQIPFANDPIMGHWFVVFNSSDAPPLYLIALAEFIQSYGRDVLEDRYRHHQTGEVRTVRQAAHKCIDFMTGMIDGLYRVPSTNPQQTSSSGVMRDGFDAYYRPVANDIEPIDYSLVAYLENQALVHEALTLAAGLIFPDDRRAGDWLVAGREVRDTALAEFWMDDLRFFAPAIDKAGQVRLESNAALELLNGPFFEGVADTPDLISALVLWGFDPENVLTPIGPRMISTKHSPNEGPYYGYQSTGAVWSVTDGIFAKGLRRQGLYPLSYDQGVGRLLGWLERAREVVELASVDRTTNEPCYHPHIQQIRGNGARVIPAAEPGQLDQGWGATAGLNEIWENELGSPDTIGWRRVLSAQALQLARLVPPAAAGEGGALFSIDSEAGWRLREERARRFGFTFDDGRKGPAALSV